MNPIQLLMNINEMTQVEAFNYCRYELKGKGTREVVKFYKNELPQLAELDKDIVSLIGSLQSNMKIFNDYLEN